MSNLALAGSIIGISAYIPLIVQILRGKTEQSFATFVLWAIMDAIAALAIINQGGNFLLPAAYSLGCAIVALAIVKSRNFSWGWFETMISCLVVVCVVVWSFSGDKMATVATTFAMVIGGLPQVGKAYRKPREQPLIPYVGFSVANILSTFAGKDWSVEERFYPVSCMVLCLMISVFIIRRYWMRRDQGGELV